MNNNSESKPHASRESNGQTADRAGDNRLEKVGITDGGEACFEADERRRKGRSPLSERLEKEADNPAPLISPASVSSESDASPAGASEMNTPPLTSPASISSEADSSASASSATDPPVRRVPARRSGKLPPSSGASARPHKTAVRNLSELKGGAASAPSSRSSDQTPPLPPRSEGEPIGDGGDSGLRQRLLAVGERLLRCEEDGVRSDMTDILIALLPLAVWGIYLFGWRVLTLTLLSVLFCLLCDAAAAWLLDGSPKTDLSAAVIGMMTVLCLPPTAPLWLPVAAAPVATIFFRRLPARLTKLRLQPAASSVLLFYLVCPSVMTALCADGSRLPALSMTAGGYEGASATPLSRLISGALPEQSVGALFVGLRPGMIGELSALLILAGFGYLCIRKAADPRLPAAMLLTVAVLSYFFPRLAIASDTISLRYAASQLLSGNLLFCATFLTFFPGSVPLTPRAKIAAGVIGGVTVFLTRSYVMTAADALPAVLILNLIARPLDLLLKPSAFGGSVRR